jgi:hypothetical protein
LTFNGLHGVICQNIELFITTGVRTSNPTCVTDVHDLLFNLPLTHLITTNEKTVLIIIMIMMIAAAAAEELGNCTSYLVISW